MHFLFNNIPSKTIMHFLFNHTLAVVSHDPLSSKPNFPEAKAHTGNYKMCSHHGNNYNQCNNKKLLKLIFKIKSSELMMTMKIIFKATKTKLNRGHTNLEIYLKKKKFVNHILKL